MAVCPRGHTSDTDDFCDECGVAMGGASTGGASTGGPSSSASPPAAPVSSASGSSASGSSASGSSAPGSSAPGSSASAASRPSSTSPASPGGGADDDEVCPWCGTPRAGRFCEEDGYDFVLAPSGPAPTVADPPDPITGPPPPSTGAFPSPSSPGAHAAAPSSTTAGGSTAPTGWIVRVEADRRYFESVLERRGPDIESVTFPTYYPTTEIPLAGAEMRIGRRRGSATTRGPEIDLSGPPLDPGVSRLHAVLLAGPTGWSVLDPGSTNGTTINYADEPIDTDTPVPVTDGDRIHVGAYTTLVVEHLPD